MVKINGIENRLATKEESGENGQSAERLHNHLHQIRNNQSRAVSDGRNASSQVFQHRDQVVKPRKGCIITMP